MSRDVTIYEIVALFLVIGGQTGVWATCKVYTMDIDDEESIRRFQDILTRNEGRIASIDTQIEMKKENQIAQTTPITEPLTTTDVSDQTTSKPMGGVPTHFDGMTFGIVLLSGCKISRFAFPGTHHSSYIQYQGNISDMMSFSGCAWIRPLNGISQVSGTLFSYCASTSISILDPCLTLQIDFSDSFITAYFNGKKDRITRSSPITNRTHLCIVRNKTKHIYYIDGQFLTISPTRDSNILPGNGVLILGHSQHGSISGSNPGAQLYLDEGFRGEIDRFEVWDRSLNASQISDIYTSGMCDCQSDALITFERHNSGIHGPVKHNWSDDCDEDDI